MVTTRTQRAGEHSDADLRPGGPLYFRLPTLDMNGLPLANFALQLGAYRAGRKP
jgi:hypothetical protein